VILRPTGRPLLRRQRHELILLVRVNVIGRLNKNAGEGEAEAAGLLGLLFLTSVKGKLKDNSSF